MALQVESAHWQPEGNVPPRLTGGTCVPYGLDQWWKLFTARQLVALATFADLVAEARNHVQHDAVASGTPDSTEPLSDGGLGATAYAEAVSAYLALGVGRQANRSAALNVWNTGGEKLEQVFARQAIPMVWSYGEGNPIGNSTGNFVGQIDYTAKALEGSSSAFTSGYCLQQDARSKDTTSGRVMSIDPPYYDNISYADLSDFFYVWIRRAIRPVFPDLFATIAVPKDGELIAARYRHASRERAESFFLDGLTEALRNVTHQTHPSFPVTIYYAFKQSESKDHSGPISTGWQTFLDAVIRAGLGITGTWPIRTERPTGVKVAVNALASSIVLVCRPRPANFTPATRRDLQNALRTEFPAALAHLQRSNIAPVDLAQASIGPGMAVFTRYSAVLNADGSPMSVRDALALIIFTLDEVLAEQEGDFDADSRWALAWFEQHGFTEGEYGVAEQLSKAKNTSVDGLVRAGIVESRLGTVRLFRPDELDPDWDPAGDRRLTVWEMTHHLIRALESGGESDAAVLAATLGSRGEVARDLAYRLYVVSERKRRAADALAYNGLVQSWPEIVRIAGEQRAMTATQGALAIDGA